MGQTLTATNHARALERLSEGPADLVVVDIGMPVMDGLQLLRLLRHVHPGQQAAVFSWFEHPGKPPSQYGHAGAVLFLEKLAAAGGLPGAVRCLGGVDGTWRHKAVSAA